MINKFINYSIHHKFVIGLFTLALVIAGIYSLNKVPIDAVPDITNNQVQVITVAPNLGTEDIEQFVTYPVEVAVANLPEVIEIRSISRFGLSVVTIVFSDDIDTYLPRQLVAEKLAEIKAQIPEGFGDPFMGPISTGLGEIYQYTLEVTPEFKDQYSPVALREIQDWLIKRQMAMVPGVVEVNAFGGGIKQYEVSIDPSELKAIGLSISDVYNALENNNQNTGGAYIEKNHQANFIRGEGLARNLADIENIVVANRGGIPITMADIATVTFGMATRYGALTKNGEGEAVGGMILMLKGANTNNVITSVKERIAEIQGSLPEGIQIKPFLDRSDLIKSTTSTVTKNLIEGALIVIFILVFFLGNWRGGLIVASTIPLALLFAFILMNLFGVWANLMSLGAIDFGIIVDGAVIIVESTVYMLHKRINSKRENSSEVSDEIAYKASSSMMNTAFFGQFIILIVFLPILALEGVEGKMFIPMALTFSFAMIGAMILCLTYVPMMAALFLKVPKKAQNTWGDRMVRWIESVYEKSLVRFLKKAKFVVIAAVVLLATAGFLFSKMGGEFIPQLDEGDIAFHVILKPGSALSETIKTTTEVERIIKSNFPEVNDVISRIGVADVPTDPMPMDIADVFILLKDPSAWTSATTKEGLIHAIKKKVEQVPGVNYEFTQPIEMRFNELITGVREDIAVKLFGDDLEVLAEKAAEMGKLISSVDGVADMKVEATSGQPQITIRYDRKKLAQYGLQINKVNDLIQTAFAGGVAGTIFEGEKRFDLVVRLKEELRQELNNVKNLFVSLPNGTQIPLKEIANISYKPGPMQISRDNTKRRIYVGINVRGRDIASLVQEIKDKIAATIKLPPGYYIRYGGAFENLERATSKLKTVVPIALGLIFVLIFFALKSMKQTLMIYMAIPLAVIGGVFSLVLRDMPFSISAGIGFIVLFGVAVLNGLVLVSGFNELKNEGIDDIDERIKQGTKRRIRPILLTALTDMLGFLPMALSGSAGAEVQRPLATVVIGGLFTATLLTLYVLPILYKWIETSQLKPMKRIHKSTSTAVLLLILSSTFGYSQEKQLSMDEAVERAIENHPTIAVAELEVTQAKVLKPTAWDFGESQLYTGADEYGHPITDPTYTLIGIRQSGINLVGIASRKKVRNRQVNLAEQKALLTKLQFKLLVKNAWIKSHIAKKIYSSYKEIDSVYSRLNTAIRLRYETEAISKLAYSTTLNQGALIRLEKDKAYSSYLKALQELNNLIAGDEFYGISMASPLESSLPQEISHEMLANHPMLEVLKEKLAVTKAETAVATSQWFPKFSIEYGIQKMGDQSGFSSYQVGVQIPLIFNKEKAKSRAAKIEMDITHKQNEAEVRRIQKDYTNLMIDYQLADRSWTYYRDTALPIALEQRNGAILSYTEGNMDYLAFLQHLKQAIQLEIEAWKALGQFLNKRAELSYYLPLNQLK